MEITKERKESWKLDKVNLRNAIVNLKRKMTEFKVERKSEWKSFKNKFNSDFADIEKSLEKIKLRHKKSNSIPNNAGIKQ
jgi:hypothetical protein